MISAVHGGTHQVYGTGVHTDVFLVGVFLMNSLGNKVSVRRHHETSEFGVNGNVSHTCGNQHFFVNLSDTFSDYTDVIGGIFRLVRDADTAGKVDEGDVCTGFLL